MIEFAIGAAVMAAGVWIGAVTSLRGRKTLPAATATKQPPRPMFPWQKKSEPEKPVPTRQAGVARWPGGTMGGLARDETPEV